MSAFFVSIEARPSDRADLDPADVAEFVAEVSIEARPSDRADEGCGSSTHRNEMSQ